MSLDTFIVFDPCTNKFFAACEAYLVDTRKLSDEEYDALLDYPSPKTQEILNKHGMTLDSCEYHKIMEDAEQEETMTQQPQKQMTPLSDATIAKLADALTDDAIKYIQLDEEYIETTVSVISRFLIDRMGQMDENLLSEICLGIFENFDITSNNK